MKKITHSENSKVSNMDKIHLHELRKYFDTGGKCLLDQSTEFKFQINQSYNILNKYSKNTPQILRALLDVLNFHIGTDMKSAS